MATTKFTTDTAVIAGLADLPNATSGLTAAQLKAKFDESATAIKTYINDTLTVEVDASLTADSGALTTHKTSSDHDGRYYTETELNAGQLDTRYYTETEIDANLVTKTDLTTTRKLSATGDFTGTLNGAAIVASEPGLSSLFTALEADKVKLRYSIEDYRVSGYTDIQTLNAAITDIPANAELYFETGRTYVITTITVSKFLSFNLNGATLQATSLSNVGFIFNAGGKIYNGTLDNVWIGFSTTNCDSGEVAWCTFINQTFSSTTTINGASNIDIHHNYFTGKARGPDGLAFYSTCQITTGALNITYRQNECYDVVGGLTCDGISSYIENIKIYNNVFDTLLEYAAKFDVGNNYLFENNVVKNSNRGIFVETYDIALNRATRSSGQNIKIINNYFENIYGAVLATLSASSACVFISGAENPYVRIYIAHNYMKNCTLGVERYAGKTEIVSNEFYNGVALSYAVGSQSSGELKIHHNLIDSTISPTTVLQDWDTSDIIGAIVLPSLVQNYTAAMLQSIDVHHNVITNFHTNAIMVERQTSEFPRVKITDNDFYAGANSVNFIRINAANGLLIHDNRGSGTITGQELKLSLTPGRIFGNIKIQDNSWQFVTAKPTTGDHVKGEVYTVSSPAPSGYANYICTTLGTPGIWKGFGLIEA